jgi:hypothetical protein
MHKATVYVKNTDLCSLTKTRNIYIIDGHMPCEPIIFSGTYQITVSNFEGRLQLSGISATSESTVIH